MEIRFDRLASLYVVFPYLRLIAGAESSIPILMYHSVTDKQDIEVHPYYRTVTSPRMFASQLEYLHTKGYKTCTLTQAVQRVQKSETTANLVVITFDDGYRDFYLHAFPVLNRYGFDATVFLPTSFIGEVPLSFKGKECITWNEARELSRQGVQFGSHTVNHPQLRDLSLTAVNEEIERSKRTIEDKLGRAVVSFAYPFAFPQTDREFMKFLRDSLERVGYENGVCTMVGRANRHSEPYFLQRLPVNSCDDLQLFRAKLAGAYDWVARPQSLAKMAKSLGVGL